MEQGREGKRMGDLASVCELSAVNILFTTPEFVAVERT